MGIQDVQVGGGESMVQKAHDVHGSRDDQGRAGPLHRAEDQAAIIADARAFGQDDDSEVLLSHDAKDLVEVDEGFAVLDVHDVVHRCALGFSAGCVEDAAEASNHQKSRWISRANGRCPKMILALGSTEGKDGRHVLQGSVEDAISGCHGSKMSGWAAARKQGCSKTKTATD